MDLKWQFELNWSYGDILLGDWETNAEITSLHHMHANTTKWTKKKFLKKMCTSTEKHILSMLEAFTSCIFLFVLSHSTNGQTTCNGRRPDRTRPKIMFNVRVSEKKIFHFFLVFLFFVVDGFHFFHQKKKVEIELRVLLFLLEFVDRVGNSSIASNVRRFLETWLFIIYNCPFLNILSVLNFFLCSASVLFPRLIGLISSLEFFYPP